MLIIMFIFGTIFGSFYNVVGYRLPLKKSIIYPSSHCPNCNHKLKTLDLIPVFSYLFLKGKCRWCHAKISSFYPFFEFITGILFTLTYLKYGFSINMIIPITFISMLIIIIISDYKYMIIPDSVLIIFGIILLIEILLINGYVILLYKIIIDALWAFITMFIIKKIGDYIFKKESMGGGDIKLMALFGLVLGYPMSIFSIFLASIIGLPVSLFLLNKNNDHIIPFGPFLSAAAIIIILLNIDFDTILNLLT